MVSVAILPVQKNNNVKIDENDFEVITQRGHGKGGQHQNKTDSAVRMRHIPTGFEVFINGRSQLQNKELAYCIIIDKIKQHNNKIQDERLNKKRKNQVGGGKRSDKTRTYNMIDGRVIDHKTGKSMSQVNKIMKGQLDLLYEV